MPKPVSSVESTTALLHRLAADGFWGDVTLKFQHGEVTHILKTESLKPAIPEHRGFNDRSSD
jgi:hypothetical protein